MSVPSVTYLEAMEAGDYQRARQDEDLVQAWEEQDDPLARVFLLVAEIHRDAAIDNKAGAITSANEARAVLEEDIDEGFERKTLLQHVDQCKEYLVAGKPLPDLPSGL